MIGRFRSWLATPVDAASLGFFRIAIGIVLILESYSHFLKGRPSTAEQYFAYPFRFRYTGFDWLPILPPEAWRPFGLVLASIGLFLALGIGSRFMAFLGFLGWTYFFLADQSYYNNHYYLLSLLLFLLIWMPCDRWGGVDAWRHRRTRDVKVPFWTVFLLRFQLFVVYFFGGVTKLNLEYLLAGEPLATKFAEANFLQRWYPILGMPISRGIEGWLTTPAAALFFSYAGLLYDLSVGFLFLFPRTRYLALGLTATFHAINHCFFFSDIGWFPLMGMLATLIFLEPTWPKDLAHTLRTRRLPPLDWRWALPGMILLPGIGVLLGWSTKPQRGTVPRDQHPVSMVVFGFVCVWVISQSLIPLRHFLIEGSVRWTTEGELFSWRMKHSTKSLAGLSIRLIDPDYDPSAQPCYRAIDPDSIDWDPEESAFVLVEPLLGYRVLLHAPVDQPRSAFENSQRNDWTQRLGRPVEVEPTLSLLATLDLVEAQWPGDRRLVSLGGDPQLEFLRAIRQQIEQLGPSSSIDPSSLAQAARQFLQRLLDSCTPEQRGTVLRNLRRMDPFVLAGKTPPADRRFWIVEIEGVHPSSISVPETDPQYYRDRGLEVSPKIWIIESQFWAHDWGWLPRFFALLNKSQESDGEQPWSIVWNPWVDLPSYQLPRLMSYPMMARQYAIDIADRWEAEHGRRPRVHIDLWIRHNRKPPRQVLDPDIDLATSPYSPLHHNPWILLDTDPSP